jgi:hypothetical protein
MSKSLSRVDEWEILKHLAIELYPMDLKKQQLFTRGHMEREAEP